MLVWVTPAQLHWSISADGGPVKIIVKNTSCNRTPINEDFYSRGSTGTIVGEKDMLPFTTQRQSSSSDDTDANRRLGCLTARAFFRFSFGFLFFLFFFGVSFFFFYLFRRLVRGEILLAQVLWSGIVESFLNFVFLLALHFPRVRVLR